MDEHERVPKKRRRLTIWRVLILSLLIGAVAFAIFRLSLRSKLNARIEAIRAAGYPVTCDKLDTWYSIPDDVKNAADTFFDAFACFNEWDTLKREGLPLFGLADLPKRTEPLSDDTKKLIAEYVADNNETIALLHAAAKIEHCRYPIDFTSPFVFDMESPHFRDMRRACHLLNLESFLHVEKGEAEAAIRSVMSGFGLSLSLTKEPLLCSQLARVGFEFLNISALELVINRFDLTDEQLEDLSQYLYKVERAADLSCGIVGDRCLVLSDDTAPSSLGPILGETVLPRPIFKLYHALGFFDMDLVICLDSLDDYVKSYRFPYHQCLKASDAIHARIESMPYIHILAHELTSAISRIITLEARTIARLQTAQVGLAIQRYRLAAGALPDTLAELVPAYLDAVPKDPFDGNELRYKKRGAGFVIYSIGEDLSDDGGAEQLLRNKRPKGQPAPNWDVTFIVER